MKNIEMQEVGYMSTAHKINTQYLALIHFQQSGSTEQMQQKGWFWEKPTEQQ